MTDAGKILILGGSGYVGSRLRRRLGAHALATFRRTPFAGGVAFDSMTTNLAEVVDLASISQAVILFGESNIAACEAAPDKTGAINVTSVIKVINTLRGAGITPLFLSSDAVFPGTAGNYREADLPAPTLRYGAQKLEVEHYLRDAVDEYLVLRAGKTYDDDPAGGTFLARWLDDIASGNTVRLVTDHRFCPIHVDDLVEVIVKALELRLSGVFHAAGPEETTYWDLFHQLLDLTGRPADSISVQPALINDFSTCGEHRPINNSLVSDALFTRAGVVRRTPEEVCRTLIAKWNAQRLGADAGHGKTAGSLR
ncbi:MAG: sugar nucleotide-binding protein [Rhodospirillales bacterium]